MRQMILILVMLSLGGCATRGETAREESFHVWLQRFHASPHPQPIDAVYSVAFVDLNGDGTDEAVARTQSQWLCGTGGCNLLVAARNGETWRLVSNVTITWPPIRLLESKSRGWHDLAVFAAGGGIRPGYEVLLPFDGTSYASNPTVGPARRAPPDAPGRTLIDEHSASFPLYP